MATSAAPTFLECCKEIDRIRMVDGGLWANNPTMVGIVEAMSLLEIDRSKISTLSIGCTNAIGDRPTSLDRGGLWQWRNAAVDAAMCGQSHGIQGQAQLLLGHENAIRLNPPVSAGLFALDRLDEDRLLSEAAHASRYFTPVFEETFMQHQAKRFVPIYSKSNSSKRVAVSSTPNESN